jgi:hypothetical protein
VLRNLAIVDTQTEVALTVVYLFLSPRIFDSRGSFIDPFLATLSLYSYLLRFFAPLARTDPLAKIADPGILSIEQAVVLLSYV